MVSMLTRLGAVLCLAACPLSAAGGEFDVLARAVAGQDWAHAAAAAAALDRQNSGQFFAAYVAAAKAASQGRCAEAAPAIETLAAARPYFVPAHELAYLCDEQLDDKNGAVGHLAAMLAILPPGPQRDLIAERSRQAHARGRPAIELHGGLTPSTNANRATAASTLPGSNWAIVDRSSPGLLASAGTSATFDLFSRPGFAAAGVLGADLGYSSVSGLLSPTLSTSVPMMFGSVGGTEGLVAPFASLGFEGKALSSHTVGIKAAVSRPLSSTIAVTLDGSVALADYPTQIWRGGLEASTHLSASWVVDPSTQLSGQLSADYDHTFDATWRTLDLSAKARVDRLLPAGFLVGLEAELGGRLHASPPPTSPPGSPTQFDLHASARIELANRNIALGPVIPVLYYQYQLQRSDNIFYAYGAQDIGIGLRARF